MKLKAVIISVDMLRALFVHVAVRLESHTESGHLVLRSITFTSSVN